MARKTCVEIIVSEDNSQRIYLDIDESDHILGAIYRNSASERKFKSIIESIFRHQTRRDWYEQYSTFEGTSVIKLSKGKENIRIYCKVEDELNNLIQYIVLSKVHHKKDQKLSKVEIRILKAIQVKSYEYKKLYR